MLSFTSDLVFYIIKLCGKSNLNNILNIKYFYNILTIDSIELCKLLLNYNEIYMSNDILLKYLNFKQMNIHKIYYILYKISIKKELYNNSFKYQKYLDDIINNIIKETYSIINNTNNQNKYTSIEYIPLIDYRDEICNYHDSMSGEINELMEILETEYEFYVDINVIINIFENNLINIKKIKYQYWNGNGGINYEYYNLQEELLTK